MRRTAERPGSLTTADAISAGAGFLRNFLLKMLYRKSKPRYGDPSLDEKAPGRAQQKAAAKSDGGQKERRTKRTTNNPAPTSNIGQTAPSLMFSAHSPVTH
jgi:hypothetical protein